MVCASWLGALGRTGEAMQMWGSSIQHVCALEQAVCHMQGRLPGMRRLQGLGTGIK